MYFKGTPSQYQAPTLVNLQRTIIILSTGGYLMLHAVNEWEGIPRADSGKRLLLTHHAAEVTTSNSPQNRP